MTATIRNICAAALAVAIAAPALAQDLRFTIINDSDHTLVAFQTAPADTAEWTDVNVDLIESGYSGNVVVEGASAVCNFDMRMVFDSGDVLEDEIDLCAMGSYTVN